MVNCDPGRETDPPSPPLELLSMDARRALAQSMAKQFKQGRTSAAQPPTLAVPKRQKHIEPIGGAADGSYVACPVEWTPYAEHGSIEAVEDEPLREVVGYRDNPRPLAAPEPAPCLCGCPRSLAADAEGPVVLGHDLGVCVWRWTCWTLVLTPLPLGALWAVAHLILR